MPDSGTRRRLQCDVLIEIPHRLPAGAGSERNRPDFRWKGTLLPDALYSVRVEG